jgi:signal transduction histidine kinase
MPKNIAKRLRDLDVEATSGGLPPLLSPGINFVSLGVFLGSVAHELQTPVTSLRAFAQLIEMNTECTPKIKEYVLEILSACTELQRSMSPLGSLLQSAGMEDPSPVALNEVVEEIASHVPEIKVELHLGKQLPQVLGNRVQIQNVIQTLFRLSFAHGGVSKVSIATGINSMDKITLTYDDNLSPTPAQTSLLERTQFVIDDVLHYAEFDTLILRSAMRRIRGSVSLTITPDGKRRLTLLFPKVQPKG